MTTTEKLADLLWVDYSAVKRDVMALQTAEIVNNGHTAVKKSPRLGSRIDNYQTLWPAQHDRTARPASNRL